MTTKEPHMSVSVIKIKSGVYQAKVTVDGRWKRYTIRKRQVLNSSARGGAYRTIWTTYHNNRFVSSHDSLADAKRFLPGLVSE